jgi:hypothetical protein
MPAPVVATTESAIDSAITLDQLGPPSAAATEISGAPELARF